MRGFDAGYRTRWAAVGAAVAITLGAGGLGVANATLDSGERATFVPLTPCRLLDTRPGENNVGSKASPLGPGEEYTVDAHGTQGACTIPNGATSLVLNVTALNATRQTNVRLYPAGGAAPTVSHLNPSPGSPPTPNAVTTDLDAAGRFTVRNNRGSVDVIIDVAGYYEDHHHDDRYYREDEADARFAPSRDRIVVSAAGFVPTSENVDHSRSAFLAFEGTTGSSCFYAPIELPHGRTIAGMSATVLPAASQNFQTAFLIRQAYAPGAFQFPESIAAAASSGVGTPTFVALTDDLLDQNQSTIDNDVFAYHLRVCLGPDDSLVAARVDLE